jgi:hypothetical protein
LGLILKACASDFGKDRAAAFVALDRPLDVTPRDDRDVESSQAEEWEHIGRRRHMRKDACTRRNAGCAGAARRGGL